MSHPQPNQSDLRQLAHEAQQGNQRAQTKLFTTLYPSVRKHINFVLGFHSSADDAVQESMVQIYRALPKFRGDSSPTTWALTIASRTARRHWRRENNRLDRADPEALDQAIYQADQQQVGEIHLLSKALAQLSLKKREVFILMAVFEYSAAEAAKILGVFANTVSSRYRHAKAELEEIYKKAEKH